MQIVQLMLKQSIHFETDCSQDLFCLFFVYIEFSKTQEKKLSKCIYVFFCTGEAYELDRSTGLVRKRWFIPRHKKVSFSLFVP